MQLNESRVLLTGATGCLGRALARKLDAAGARLLLTGRDAKQLGDLQASLKHSAAMVCGDLADATTISSLAKASRALQVNLLLNNAGANGFGLLENQSWPDTQRILASNLEAPIHLTQSLLPVLRGQPEAAIVNIGSTFGSIPFAGFATYSAAKAGLRAFSQALRRELADSPIRVIHLSPRAIDTPLNSVAVRKLNEDLNSQTDDVEQIASKILRAIEREPKEQHFGMPEGFFAWLNGVAPRLIDHALADKLHIIKKHARHL